MKLRIDITAILALALICSLEPQDLAAADGDVEKATKSLTGNWSVKYEENSVRAEAEERVRGRLGNKSVSEVEFQRQIVDELPKVEKRAKRRAESWILCLNADGTVSDFERSVDGKRKRPSHDKKVAHWKVSVENGKLGLFLEGAPEPKALLKLVSEDEFVLTYASAKRVFVRVKVLPAWATAEPAR